MATDVKSQKVLTDHLIDAAQKLVTSKMPLQNGTNGLLLELVADRHHLLAELLFFFRRTSLMYRQRCKEKV
jgi:hypothetical protein